jgi:nucleoid-associated protein YgaU
MGLRIKVGAGILVVALVAGGIVVAARHARRTVHQTTANNTDAAASPRAEALPEAPRGQDAAPSSLADESAREHDSSAANREPALPGESHAAEAAAAHEPAPSRIGGDSDLGSSERSFRPKADAAAIDNDRKTPSETTPPAPSSHAEAPHALPSSESVSALAGAGAMTAGHTSMPPAVDVAAGMTAPPMTETTMARTAASHTDTQPSSTADAANMTQHVIVAGDNYSTLAKKYLGSSKYAMLIARANPGKDPRKLQPGMKITIPPAPKEAVKTAAKPSAGAAPSGADVTAPTVAASPASKVDPAHAYTVKTGEGWHELARRFLGDARRWPELYELNRDRVPRNPEALRDGTVIEIPAGVKIPAQKAATSKPS